MTLYRLRTVDEEGTTFIRHPVAITGDVKSWKIGREVTYETHVDMDVLGMPQLRPAIDHRSTFDEFQVGTFIYTDAKFEATTVERDSFTVKVILNDKNKYKIGTFRPKFISKYWLEVEQGEDYAFQSLPSLLNQIGQESDSKVRSSKLAIVIYAMAKKLTDHGRSGYHDAMTKLILGYMAATESDRSPLSAMSDIGFTNPSLKLGGLISPIASDRMLDDESNIQSPVIQDPVEGDDAHTPPTRTSSPTVHSITPVPRTPSPILPVQRAPSPILQSLTPVPFRRSLTPSPIIQSLKGHAELSKFVDVASKDNGRSNTLRYTARTSSGDKVFVKIVPRNDVEVDIAKFLSDATIAHVCRPSVRDVDPRWGLELNNADKYTAIVSPDYGITLAHYLKLSGTHIETIINDVIAGLNALTEVGIMHYDCHIGNVLVDVKTYRATIIDFDRSMIDGKITHSMHRDLHWGHRSKALKGYDILYFVNSLWKNAQRRGRNAGLVHSALTKVLGLYIPPYQVPVETRVGKYTLNPGMGVAGMPNNSGFPCIEQGASKPCVRYGYDSTTKKWFIE